MNEARVRPLFVAFPNDNRVDMYFAANSEQAKAVVAWAATTDIDPFGRNALERAPTTPSLPGSNVPRTDSGASSAIACASACFLTVLPSTAARPQTPHLSHASPAWLSQIGSAMGGFGPAQDSNIPAKRSFFAVGVAPGVAPCERVQHATHLICGRSPSTSARLKREITALASARRRTSDGRCAFREDGHSLDSDSTPSERHRVSRTGRRSPSPRCQARALAGAGDDAHTL